MKRILLIPLLTVSLLAGSAKAANWSATVKIATIEVANINLGPGVWLSFTSPPYSSHNCSAQNGQYMLGGGAANVDKMTAVATAAYVNSRNVSVYWGGACSGGGTSGYPILLGVTLK